MFWMPARIAPPSAGYVGVLRPLGLSAAERRDEIGRVGGQHVEWHVGFRVLRLITERDAVGIPREELEADVHAVAVGVLHEGGESSDGRIPLVARHARGLVHHDVEMKRGGVRLLGDRATGRIRREPVRDPAVDQTAAAAGHPAGAARGATRRSAAAARDVRARRRAGFRAAGRKRSCCHQKHQQSCSAGRCRFHGYTFGGTPSTAPRQ